jgi:transposase-like protein
MAKASPFRPFVAKMPEPFVDESLLGYMDRALQNTMIRNVRHAFRMAGSDPDPNTTPNASKLTEEAAAGVAALFKLDPQEVRRRWYRRDHGSSGKIEFFGTTIRSQYWESRYRRVSPRALAMRPSHRALWEIRAFGFDSETNEPLLETCPVCGRRLGWIIMRGPTKCDHCIGEDGYPSTDLRDHPQPILEFEDEEAVRFVVNLVHPDPARRRVAMALAPSDLAGATDGDLFEAAMCMASALRPGAAHRMTDAGRPLRAPDFAAIAPDMLGVAGRALIGGESGFASLTARMRLSADERTASHGLYKELGPLAYMPLDRHLSPVVRRFANDAIARDLARTRDDGFVRRSVPRLADEQGGLWWNLDALSAELGIRKHALARVADSGTVEVRRADGEHSPVLMKISDVAPLVAAYKDSVLARTVTALLRVPATAIEDLARRKLIQRAEGPVAAMLPEKRYYRESSARALLIAIRGRALPAGEGGRRAKLIVAARKFGRAATWPDIVEGITAGTLRIHSKKPFGRDWRYAVTVDEAELGRFLDRVAGVGDPCGNEPWLTRDQAAQLLGVDETIVWGLGKHGFLTKREGHVAMFSRAEVERVASRYIFGPEMIRRSIFGQGAQLNRWLKSVGVLPVATLRGKNAKVYDRVQFESVLHLQPKPLDEVVIQPRQKYRIPQKDKEQAIAAVRSGLTPHHVGQRMGVNPTTVARWVKEFEATGRIQPAGKLDPYATRIAQMIEASPARSTHALHLEFMKREQLKVAYTRFSSFIAELGYGRDPKSNRLQKI